MINEEKSCDAAHEFQATSHVLHALPAVTGWQQSATPQLQAQAVDALEDGKVLFLPALPFHLALQEQPWLRPDCVRAGSKSAKFSPGKPALWGVDEKDKQAPGLLSLLQRYAESAQQLINALFPHYTSSLMPGNTSYRPVEVQGRVQSLRHDDRLLHVDAFPSRPNGGQRLLRVFTNIDPESRPRVWRVGEPFADVAKRFLPRIRAPLPGSAALLKALHITKSRRTPYDHYMLGLHDSMKHDAAYQRDVRQTPAPFPSGSSWIVFSDQVSHAALSGQYALEQTFLLPVSGMARPERSPLRVLEALKGQRLD